MKEFILNTLPLNKDIETKTILKKSISANSALARLNGVAKVIPNSTILINALALQEAKDSSAIENIITTHDELYRANIDALHASHQAKEVQRYKQALLLGVDWVNEHKWLVNRDIIQLQSIIEGNNAGIRRQSGTVLKNEQTGEVIYTPPQQYDLIQGLLANLEQYINQPNDIDPLVNMAIIHYQFESIHPFYDGNGRTGRIINILYLMLNHRLDLPILYLSAYIIKNKADYYRLLQEVRTKANWQQWIFYMLDAIEQTALQTIEQIHQIESLMMQTKQQLKTQLPKIYSKDLIEIIFTHPYTKIEFLVNSLGVSRQTASKYLQKLENLNIMQMIQIKNSKYYIHISLFNLLRKGI